MNTFTKDLWPRPLPLPGVQLLVRTSIHISLSYTYVTIYTRYAYDHTDNTAFKLHFHFFWCVRHIPVMLELPFIMTLGKAAFTIEIIITIKAHDSRIFITNDTPWQFLLQSIYEEIITSFKNWQTFGENKRGVWVVNCLQIFRSLILSEKSSGHGYILGF